MINCYHILKVPNFSDSATIKKSYRVLAKRYHPDSNTPERSAQTFAIISKAYQTLTTPAAKIIHDEQLKKALLYESEEAYRRTLQKPKAQNMSVELRRKWAFQAAQKEIRDYEKKEKIFPVRYKIASGGFAAIFSLGIVYKNYFVDLNSNDLPMIVLGYSLFVISCVSILAAVYKKLRIDLLLQRAKYAYDKFSFTLFFTMVIAGPVLVFGISSYRKSYHLKHYPVLVSASIVELTPDSTVLFAFRPMGSEHMIMKRKDISEEKHLFNLKEKWVVVRYSEADPRIVELVEKRKH